MPVRPFRFVARPHLVRCVALLCLGVPLGFPAVEAQDHGLSDAMVQAIAKAERSVVAISRVRLRAGSGDSLLPAGGATVDPTDPNFVPNDFATGLIIEADGLVLTNSHVIQGGDSAYYVTTVGRRTYAAQVLASDPRGDLAVLKIDASGLEPVVWGDAEKLRKGQIVITLGNPYAIARDGEASASWGIVSNLRRKAPVEFGLNQRGASPSLSNAALPNATLHQFGTLIQTDAKLHFGTSGGALINLDGATVGVTTALAALDGYEEAAGYAIPVDATFHRIVERLREGREVEYGFLGVSPRNLSADEVAAGMRGVRVELAVPGTPAERAGLSPEDVITHLGGEPVTDTDRLFLLVGRQPAGATVQITVTGKQGGRPRELPVRLAKCRVAPNRVVTRPESDWRGARVDYMTAHADFQIGRLPVEDAVFVTEVIEESAAWRGGLRSGMFVTHVNGRPVTDPIKFQAAVKDVAGEVRLRIHGQAEELVLD